MDLGLRTEHRPLRTGVREHQEDKEPRSLKETEKSSTGKDKSEKTKHKHGKEKKKEKHKAKKHKKDKKVGASKSALRQHSPCSVISWSLGSCNPGRARNERSQKTAPHSSEVKAGLQCFPKLALAARPAGNYTNNLVGCWSGMLRRCLQHVWHHLQQCLANVATATHWTAQVRT